MSLNETEYYHLKAGILEDEYSNLHVEIVETIKSVQRTGSGLEELAMYAMKALNELEAQFKIRSGKGK